MDGLLCLLTEKIDSELMDSIGPQLKVISSMSVGVDHIDVAAATARGIPVGNTPGVLTDATADQAFALMLCRCTAHSRSGKIPAGRQVGDMESKPACSAQTSLAQHWELLALAELVRQLPNARRDLTCGSFITTQPPNLHYGAQPVDLDTLLRESDFVSIHVPLTEKTRHLVNAEFLAKMKPNAVLVNTARGGVLDQTALYLALKSNQIFAAALDVTDPEPLPMDSPLLELGELHHRAASRQRQQKDA